MLLINTAAEGTPQATGIPAYAPANSDTLVVAPYTENWWAKITAMAPREFMLDQITPDHDLKIAHIGYSRSQDTVERPVPGPLRVFFIEAADAAEAGRIATWLKSATATITGPSMSTAASSPLPRHGSRTITSPPSRWPRTRSSGRR
ncbi:hypothetical protein [Arthrobacter methylotrophus]|uniref:hypothetical protein n=1 Tax=Arthrobacter methylotrophus TaxID=121291 RepID=UPI0031EA9FA9